MLSSLDCEIDQYLDGINLIPYKKEKCLQCNKMCSIYCCNCLRIVSPSPEIPTLELPVSIGVILDDSPKKCTGIHLKLLCPGSAHVWQRCKDEIPEFDPETTVVVFPSATSIPIASLSMDAAMAIQNVILLDCKWTNYGRNMTDEKLKHLKFVRLTNPPKLSRFWRWHTAGEGCISTIEAAYCALRELFDLRAQLTGVSCIESAELLKLLYLFGLQRKIIQSCHHVENDDAGDGSDPTSDAFKSLKRYHGHREGKRVKHHHSRLTHDSDNDNDDSPMPFAQEDNIPYGSLLPVAPHVTSPLMVSQEIISWLGSFSIDICHQKTLLYDLGCGNGLFIRRLCEMVASPELTCIGLDIDSNFISDANSQNIGSNRIEFRQCDIFESFPIIALEMDRFDQNQQSCIIIIYMFLVPHMLNSVSLKQFMIDFLHHRRRQDSNCIKVIISYGSQIPQDETFNMAPTAKHALLDLFLYT